MSKFNVDHLTEEQSFAFCRDTISIRMVFDWRNASHHERLAAIRADLAFNTSTRESLRRYPRVASATSVAEPEKPTEPTAPPRADRAMQVAGYGETADPTAPRRAPAGSRADRAMTAWAAERQAAETPAGSRADRALAAAGYPMRESGA